MQRTNHSATRPGTPETGSCCQSRGTLPPERAPAAFRLDMPAPFGYIFLIKNNDKEEEIEEDPETV